MKIKKTHGCQIDHSSNDFEEYQYKYRLKLLYSVRTAVIFIRVNIIWVHYGRVCAILLLYLKHSGR